MSNTLQISPFAPAAAPGQVRDEAKRLLRESVGAWEMFSQMDYYKARFGGGDGLTWQPIIPPTAFGSRHNRKDGRNQYTHWTEEHLLMQRDAARRQEATEPIAQGVLGQIINFTVCDGLTYHWSARKELPPDVRDSDMVRRLADLCSRRLDAFWERYEQGTGHRQTRPEFEREFVNNSIIDGERFLRFFRRPEGLMVRQLDPEYVRQPPGQSVRDGWSFGVCFTPGDVVSRRGYYVIREMDTLQGDPVPASQILHYTRNVPVNVLRGVSDFFCLIDDLTDVGQLVDAIRSGAKQRAKIAIIRSHKDADNDTLSSFANTNALAVGLSRVNPVTGETERVSWTPDGAIVDVGDNMDHKTMPAGATLEHIEAAKFGVYNLSCKWNLPNFMVLGDTNDYNYASVLVAGGPAVRRFKREQGEFCGRFRMLARKVIAYDALMGLGGLPEDVLRYVDVQVEAPDPVIYDRVKEVQADQIEIQEGVLSVPTAQQKRGYDPDEEDRNIAAWKDAHPQASPLPAVPFGMTGDEPTAPNADAQPENA